MPNSYVSRRSTEAQAFSHWEPPTGTLGELVASAEARANTLRGRAAELGRAASAATVGPGFRAALVKSKVGVIAEVKRASPSRGPINPGLRASDQARAYERGGAVAISVLTEGTRFGGTNEDLSAVRSGVKIPVLRKDFHVDPVQLLEARSLGGAAALVIVRAVPPARLAELLETARDIGLETLVEVRNEAELGLALSLGAELIGVNNRDLETLAVDLTTMDRVLPLIPRWCVAVAESGIVSRADIERAASHGADAVLIGGVLSASGSPEDALRPLTSVTRVTNARKN